MEKLKGYKTVAFNVVMGIVTVLAIFNPDAQLPNGEMVSENLEMVFSTLTAVTTTGNLILRAITNSPIFKKKETPNA